MLVNDNSELKNNKKYKKHKWFPITKFNDGKLVKYEQIPIFNSLPSLVDHFRGRQQEMWEVISHLQENRVVNILGPPGIGKTSLARTLWNHLRDRKKFFDGIIYLTLRGCESAQMFLTRLMLHIETLLEANKKSDIPSLWSSKQTSENDDIIQNEKELEKMRNYVLKILREKEVLLVLDGWEAPLEDDSERFVKEVDLICLECPNIKLLLTSRKYLNKLEHNREMPYHLYSLSPQATLKLLLDKSPREIKTKEIEELLNYKIPIDHPIHQQFPSISNSITSMLDHPFTLMLGGHPQAVSLAAPMLERQSLKDLFEQLLDSNIMDVLNKEGNQSYASLRLSLEISIKNIKKERPRAIELFKFIGLLPGGVNQNELTELWGSSDWRDDKEQLIKASLLVYRQSDNVLIMLPFMNTRAYELLEEDGNLMKTEYHLKCCNFYKQFWVRFIERINLGSYSMKDFVEKESNIWAWIYRGINRKKNNDNFDEEEEEMMPHSSTLQDINLNFLQGKNLARSISLSSKFLWIFKINLDEENGLLKNKKHQILKQMTAVMEEQEDQEDLNENYDEEEDFNDIHNLVDIKLVKNQSVNLQPVQNNLKPSSLEPSKSGVFGRNSNQQLDSLALMEFTKIKSGILYERKASGVLKSLNKNNRRRVSLSNSSEEMLVIYYISIVIRLWKLSDAQKAIQEYQKKKGLSNRALAHIYKLRGVLAMLSEKKEMNEAKNWFKQALQYFYKIGSEKGRAICRLALVRVQWEIEFIQERSQNLKSLVSIAEKAKDQFQRISCKIGEERANAYIHCLQNKINGDNLPNLKTFAKLMTLKGDNNLQEKSKEAHLEK